MKKTNAKFYSKEEAYNILSRIDAWIGNCDTKFSVLLALLGIFFGLTINVFTVFSNLRKIITNWNEIMIFDRAICIICCILIIVYIILIIMCTIFSVLGINARIKNANNNPIFFVDIAKNNDYIEMENNFKSLTEKEYVSYLNEQIYTNSKICTKKYSYYKKALFCLFPAILIVVISLILLFI